MTERTAMRILWVAIFLAAAALVGLVGIFEAGDEALVYGAVSIGIVSSLAAGYVTSHYGASRRHKEE